jgi:hypothetical protein
MKGQKKTGECRIFSDLGNVLTSEASGMRETNPV